MKKVNFFENERLFEKGRLFSMRIQRHVRVIYSTDQCGYRDTFGLYTLQINADTETRSGYILYRSMRIQRHVRVIYSTDQCGYRDTFGLYTLQINADTETRSGYILYKSMRIQRHVRVIPMRISSPTGLTHFYSFNPRVMYPPPDVKNYKS